MARVLVTGGAGAIGSNLIPFLQLKGFDITVLDDLSSGRRELLPSNIKFIHGQVQNDDDLNLAFKDNPDYVIHMAALFANQNSVDHPVEDLMVSGVGIIKLLDKSVKAEVKNFIYVSSSCVYGNQLEMLESATLFQPDTPYAISKLLGERYCKFWADQHGLSVAVVRLFNSYGPGEYPGPYRNVIPNFFSKAIKGEPLIITGTGDEVRDFTYVDDIVAGIYSALISEHVSGKTFNLASARPESIIKLANYINEISCNKAGIEFAPRRSWDHVIRRVGNIDKARLELNFMPMTRLYEGLEKTYAWLKSQNVS